MTEPALRRLEVRPTDSQEAAFSRVLDKTVSAIEGAGVAYVLIGGVGSVSLGRPRWTHDIDVLVTPIDAERALDALAGARR